MRYEDIKTPYDLKYMLPEDNYFFTRTTMRFFGDTMRNYGLRRHVMENGDIYYELTRRSPVKHGVQSNAWFGLAEDGIHAKRVYL